MSKIKMRCITCGKWFQSANAKEVTCPECVQKARKEKMASKAAPPAAPKQGTSGIGSQTRPGPLPPKQKPVANTSHWFDSLSDVKVSEPDPPLRPKLPPSSAPAPREPYGGQGYNKPGSYRDERAHGSHRGPGSQRDERTPGNYRGPGNHHDERERPTSTGYRGPGSYRNAPLSGSIVGGIGHRPRQPMENTQPGRGPRPGERRVDKYHTSGPRGNKPAGRPRPAPAPKPKREKIPPPEPFKPTPEQIAQVETRYLELAIPSEFDGIRSQIAVELSIPKRAVKQIIKALRDREQIPSWWEAQTYKGDNEEKEKIKVAYEPFLPIPPVGVHRRIADELDLKPGLVYQAIKTIRTDLNLPQYNDPTLHAEEFAEIHRKAREVREAAKAARAESQVADEKAVSVQVLTVTNEDSATAPEPSTGDQNASEAPAESEKNAE